MAVAWESTYWAGLALDILGISEDASLHELEADICVVGSGPGGAFASVELASAGFDVLVVEAGTSIADIDPDESIGTISVLGGANLMFGFSRQLGGSSNLWAGRVTQLENIDFEKRAWVPESGWPLSRRDLEPYYSRAAEIMKVPISELTTPCMQQVPSTFVPVLAPEAETSLDVKRFFWTEQPFNTGDFLKSAAQEYNGRLRIVTNARVRRLAEKPEASIVCHAEVAGPGGRSIKIKARHFILAAGGIETPRILLNSTGTRATGIGNEHDVVGRYLATHPKSDIGVLILHKRIATASALFSDVPVQHGKMRYGLGLSARAQTRIGTLNHYVQLSPILEYHANKLFELVKSSSVLKSPFVDRSRIVCGVLPGLGYMAFEAIGRIAGMQRMARTFMLRGFLDQYPDPENRITRSQSVDRFGDNKVDLRWRFGAKDQQSVLLLFSELERKFKAAQLGEVQSELHNMAEWPLTGIHSHFMGTTRMGDDPKRSVVDHNCRVFGIANLFISGPSTFPTGGYANPFLTIAALSLRLADYLKTRRN